MGCFSDSVRFLLMNIVPIPLLILSTPIRWIYEFLDLYHPGLFRRRNTRANHLKKVEAVQSQVVDWNKKGRQKRMCTARPTWKTLSMRALDKSKFTQIEIDLEDIIEINTQERVILAEPGMKMGTLTYKLLSLGWTIPVIPEFESLTIAVTIRLLPAPKYVRLEYHVAGSVAEAQNLLEKYEFDFLEGIAYSLDKIVVMHGKFSAKAERGKINSVNRWYKPFFYKHVESMLKNRTGMAVEFIPTRDYYHRHQRSFFWELAVTFPIGNNTVLRHLMGWVYPFNLPMVKRVMIKIPTIRDRMLTDRHVLQDFLIPLSQLENMLKLSDEEFQKYPIWLCPCKFFKNQGLAPLPPNSDEMYIDVGIYGVSPIKGPFNMEVKTRKMEAFTTDCNGFQFLYADTYMTRDEFRNMFDMNHYDAMRKKYNCEDAFPEIYDKVSMSARY